MNIFSKVKNFIDSQFEDDLIIEVVPRISTFQFPTKNRLPLIQEKISKFSNEYKIWNLSEYSYNPRVFDLNVIDYTRPGLPCPSFCDIIIIIEEITNWLKAESSNLAFIHCQDSFSRTSIILKCLLYYLSYSRDIEEISNIVDNKLKTKSVGNQKRYLIYFFDYMNNFKINKFSFSLTKISIVNFSNSLNKIPGDQNSDSRLFYLQIFQNSQLIYNSENRYC